MPRKWRRREIIQAMIVGMVGSYLGLAPEAAAEPALTFPQVSHWCQRLLTASFNYPARTMERPDSFSPATINDWAQQTAPYFLKCGLETTWQSPASINLVDMSAQFGDNGADIMGVTYCDRSQVQRIDGMEVGEVKKVVTLNQWFTAGGLAQFTQSPLGWWALTHELVHVQEKKLCQTPAWAKTPGEVAAQIVTAEILAHQAADGNTTAAIALLYGLVFLCLQTAKYFKDSTGLTHAQSYAELVQLACHYLPTAAVWWQYPFSAELSQVYAVQPLQKIVTSHYYGQDRVAGLPFTSSTLHLRWLAQYWAQINQTTTWQAYQYWR